MKAIETVYNGYRFRSRLEARWAVFFDALGVKYEYEPEGFNLGNHLCYLPDFRVKCWGTRGQIWEEPFDLYIEVKGNMTREDAEKIINFSKDHAVLIVGNIPDKDQSWSSIATHCYEEMNGIRIYPFNHSLIDGDSFGAYPAAHEGKFFLWGDESSQIWNIDEVEAAYAKARQARFEHGECG